MRFVEKWARFVPLSELRETAGLEDMPLLNRSRLSVQPVTDEQWKIITAIAEQG